MDSRELEAVRQLRALLQEVYALAPADPQQADGPAVSEVLAGLGYVVALQNAPDIGQAVPDGLSRAMLESLLQVIREWLVRQARPKVSREVAGFYQRAGEHVQRLRTPTIGRGD